MKGKTTLTAIALSVPLILGIAGCGQPQNEYPRSSSSNVVETINPPPTIFGNIIDIDEDSFAIRRGDRGANFNYELLFVETSTGIKTILAPQPTEFRIGDELNSQYISQDSISFEDMVDKYAASSVRSMQNGYLNIDGILPR